ncbi:MULTISPECIES: ABC transporter ATP-binding protein/permease [Lactiplantibacillus]|uniref:ATP-binding cassette domain-containing protein n=3 Tax=Lactiplantibacillus pentosus TaxID=1589 RepID=A0AAX6LC95_LACPE|nr:MULTISPECIES: ABC transporter ATP-binding protein/permease [Lactiplantibacillus]MBU7448355.1 ATP-binding cassette domain-containing protein [Lactiplantibacillus sp. 7.2.4]MBU7480135.1 ATP-binding cassette domain-containing protein [Lactiplantibacillus pentosus]MBU7497826.1 ATP-binding cassette domain-containing protein [Lactiplantibacillus pentosus]MCC3162742.1 ATP-binding cassette domain-containing protein [Lactiplantibacillus pentosus]MCJ8186739.1 ATP-binding cassette domain-containing pr
MSYLELTNIHKSYQIGKQKFDVLKGINLQFELGEFVAIVGESGGGKTTLVNIISGLDHDFAGTVRIAGQLLDYHHEKQLDQYRREVIGYISQSYNLIAHLTVLENVMLALDMTKLSHGERLRRAHELLAQVGLTAQIRKYPQQLSGGQKQRVAIARALAGDPQILIADEPTGALDADNTAEVMAMLQKIAQDGRLVICVTHSQRVAHAASRIAELNDGHIQPQSNANGQQQASPVSVGAATDAGSPKKPQPIVRQQLPARPLPWHVSVMMAFKHMRHTWTWNTLIVIGTAIGLFAVMLFNGLGTGIKGYINHEMNALVDPQSIMVMHQADNAKDREEQAAAVYDPAVAGGIAARMPVFTGPQLTALRDLKHVTTIEPGISATNATIAINRQKFAAPELTTWTSDESTRNLKVGHVPGNNQIVLDKSSIAQKWSGTKWRQLVGQPVSVSYQTFNLQGKPVTISRTLTVAGIVDSSSEVGINALNYQTMQSMRAAAKVSTQPTFVTARITSRMQNQAVVNEINHLTIDGKRPFAATSISATLDSFNTYVNIATAVLAAIAGISLVVSALMIIVTMFMSVSARMKEIGILRSLGERRRDIRRLFTSEALMIGLISATIATGLSYVAARGLNHMLAKLTGGYALVQIQFSNIVVVFILAIVIAWLAAILPARRAARANPIKALLSE